jgi:hypothetical protein
LVSGPRHPDMSQNKFQSLETFLSPKSTNFKAKYPKILKSYHSDLNVTYIQKKTIKRRHRMCEIVTLGVDHVPKT